MKQKRFGKITLSMIIFALLFLSCKKDVEHKAIEIKNAKEPIILNQLTDDTIVIPQCKIFVVNAYSVDNGILTYQWYSITEESDIGEPVENATTNILRLDVIELGRYGYYCEITNTINDNGDGGRKSVCIKTETAWLDAIYLENVISAPAIIQQPPKILVVPFDTYSEIKCVGESYKREVTYRWYESIDGTTANGIPLPNAYSSTLRTPKITEEGSHYYYCVVANKLSTDNISTKSEVAYSNITEVTYTGLPLICIDTVGREEPTCEYVSMEGKGGKTIKNATKVPSRLKIFKSQQSVPIYDSGEYIEDNSGCTIKIRGNTSAYGAKKPYKIKLQKKADLLGDFIGRSDKMYKDKNWILLKDATDLKTFIGFDVSAKLGNEWTPNYIYANLVLNGDYRGIYMLVESVKDSESRVNISNNGFLIENDAYYWNEDLYFITDLCNIAISFKYPDSDEMTESDARFQYIKNYMNATDISMINNTYDEYIDYDSFARWFLIHDVLGTYDMAGTNMYISKFDNTPESKIKMVTPWDFNSIYGSYTMEFSETQIESFSRLHNGFRVYAKYLFNSENPLFIKSYKKQWYDIKDNLYYYLLESLNQLEQNIGDEIDFSRYCDAKRWNLSYYNTVKDDIDIATEWFECHLPWLDTAIEGLGNE